MRSVIKVLFARKLYPLKTTQLRGLITPDFVETNSLGSTADTKSHRSWPGRGSSGLYMTETTGVYQPTGTIAEVAARKAEIGDRRFQKIFDPLPGGFNEHLAFSPEMARGK